MLVGMLNQISILIGCVIITFILGYFKGRNDQKVKKLEANVKDIIKTKKRRKKRKSDDIDIIRRRMHQYTIG
ncbi:MAG: hypothetical protein ACI9TO_000236 [Rickettsiales bacterium]|jgi:hypothetical protein